MFLLQLSYYGELVIPAPAWVSYAPQARIIGRNIRWMPTTMANHWHPTAEQLEELCREDPRRPRILVLNYPCNPTGRTFSTEELEDLARVAREHHALILSDEIYGKLHHRDKHVSIARFYPEGTIFSGGLSKWCGAGGWRLGLFVFPPALRWLQEAMAAVGTETYTSTSAPIQYAAIQAFREGPEIERYLAQSRSVLAALGNLLARRLADAGAAVLPPEGAFYLFPDFSPLRERLEGRGIRTSVEMCRSLLEDTGRCHPARERLWAATGGAYDTAGIRRFRRSKGARGSGEGSSGGAVGRDVRPSLLRPRRRRRGPYVRLVREFEMTLGARPMEGCAPGAMTNKGRGTARF